MFYFDLMTFQREKWGKYVFFKSIARQVEMLNEDRHFSVSVPFKYSNLKEESIGTEQGIIFFRG